MKGKREKKDGNKLIINSVINRMRKETSYDQRIQKREEACLTHTVNARTE